MAEKDTTKVTMFEDVWNASTSDSLYNDFLTGVVDIGGDTTGLTKDMIGSMFKTDFEKEFIKTYGYSQKDFKPGRVEGEIKTPEIGGPSLGERTSEFFGDIPGEAMILPSIFAAKYLEKGGGKVVEGLKDVTKRGYTYLSSVLGESSMSGKEIAHFMDSEDVQRGVSRINKLQEKIVQATNDGLSKKKIAKLNTQLNTLVNRTAKFLTTEHFNLKTLEATRPKDVYFRRGYNVSVDKMKDILKNHKNWSLFHFKGEISKIGWPKAAKDFFKKGTAVTRFGQDMVSWKIGTGIGDAIIEHTGIPDFWGKDLLAGWGGYKLAPKVGKKIEQFVTNLPDKAKKFFNNGKTQKVANKILKKSVAKYGASTAAGTLAGGIPGIIIGLTGIGLTINDLRKLYLNWDGDESEEEIEMSIEEMLEKAELPEKD